VGGAADVGAQLSTVASTEAQRTNNQRRGEGLRCRITFRDGRQFAGELPAEEHRRIQLAMLHRETDGFVELTPGTRDPDGRLHVDRRSRPEHYLPGGASRRSAWLGKLLEHARRITAGEYARPGAAGGSREEVFVGVSARHEARGSKHAVSETRFLWVDIDRPDRLEVLWEFLAERPCRLLVSSGRGVHAYWALRRPLPAILLDATAGQPTEPIERANGRLIHHLGADPQCKDRGRVIRLAGTRNYKRDESARVVTADFALPPYTVKELVGDLPDPKDALPASCLPKAQTGGDPYRLIPAVIYLERLAGRKPDRAGFVRCPAPGHTDEHPSCSVRGSNPTCWVCRSCGAGGGIYDLASLLLGGPYGRGRLHGDAFKAARELVISTFGPLGPDTPRWAQRATRTQDEDR
jgi:hypothetical protein